MYFRAKDFLQQNKPNHRTKNLLTTLRYGIYFVRTLCVCVWVDRYFVKEKPAENVCVLLLMRSLCSLTRTVWMGRCEGIACDTCFTQCRFHQATLHPLPLKMCVFDGCAFARVCECDASV